MTSSQTLTLDLSADISLSGACYSQSGQMDTTNTRFVILLHGWGADGADLAPLAPMLCQPSKNMMIFTPDAPEPCDMNPFGRQWFSLSEALGDENSRLDSERIVRRCQDSLWMVEAMIQAVCDRFDMSASDVLLGGFSQGGMMALAGGLAMPQSCRGLFCLSGGQLAPRPVETSYQGPVLLVHGDADPVVPISMMVEARDVLKAQNIDVHDHQIAGLSHGIDQQVVQLVSDFISS